MVRVFGHMPDGAPVHRVTLRGGGLRANLLTYGAVLQDLRLQGHAAALVLGFDSFAPYLTHSPYFGTIAGRCANRIRDGHLDLGGTTFQLDQNFLGKHTLHGGAAGLGKRVWTLVEHNETSATLAISSDDGDMGFPGNLDIRATFSLMEGGILDIRLGAQSDATTLCNLAHHSYFNLDGTRDISLHRLRIAAQNYLPVDAELIPTGEVRAVSETRFDFRSTRPILDAQTLDHNFCLSTRRQELRPVAWLSSAHSGLTLECWTTEPGLQIYDAAKVDIALPGLGGAPMGRHAGLAMEPQVWPDANHHPHFPQAVLGVGDTYDQHTQYIFVKRG